MVESPLDLDIRERMTHYRSSVWLMGESLYILSRYTPTIRQVIHRAKYSHDTRAIARLSDLSRRAYEQLSIASMIEPGTRISLISPRSHIVTRLWRRWDLVGDMSRLWWEMLSSDGYRVTQIRVSHRWSYSHQASRSRADRSQKRNRFFLANTDLRSIVDDWIFLYLDDVISTGSTLAEIQSLFRERHSLDITSRSTPRSFFICLSSSHI